MPSAEQFSSFYEAVHGYKPFHWQERLAARVVEEGRWPDVLDLPTGAGKTSAIDVALFSLACKPDTFPRRTVLIVDRRVVVDQAAEHAKAIQQKLTTAATGALGDVATSLRALCHAADGEPPIVVSVLRGGAPREDAWASRPDRPVVALSTVDQVGSRILFRGYGVSSRMASVHAGLLGNDTLFLLDEVHLSIPFCETLLAVRKWRNKGSLRPETGLQPRLPDRWAVVQMSATPAASGPDAPAFTLDREESQLDERLDRRLKAHKRARLEPVKVRGKDEAEHRQALARRAAEEAREVVKAGARSVAVVMNRVESARLVHNALAGSSEFDAVLLTGRMRPLDRDTVMKTLRGRIIAGRSRHAKQRPIVVSATQCIEAGADFDFDALVTECASLDALRQRFGRLDRLGDLGESRAVVLATTAQISAKDDDAVYGRALAATWAWLCEKGSEVDFGIDHLSLPPADRLDDLVAPHQHAPLLTHVHLDAWTQTSPAPAVDPDVSLWLHGPERGAPDVQVVWRANLRQDSLTDAAQDEERAAPNHLVEMLAACPPSSLEAVSVPLYAAKAWLQGRPQDLSDVEGARVGDASGDEDGHARPVLRWKGNASRVAARPSEIRPGDILVVPATYGGIADNNWDPHSNDQVEDLGDLAQWHHRGRAVLRLHPDLVRRWPVPSAEDLAKNLPTVPSDEELDSNPRVEINAWLQGLSDMPEPWSDIVRALGDRPRRIPVAERSWTLVGRRRQKKREEAEVTTEDDTASFLGRKIELDRHCRDVRTVAQRFCRSVGLPEELARDLALAAWFHDVGKADPRFQRMLVGGSAVRFAALEAPLAKSEVPPQNAAAARAARERANYPKGYRHELLSVAMIAGSSDALRDATDPELVTHLVGSHHGWCRPFAPALAEFGSVGVALTHGGVELHAETDHHLARLDSGVADRFWTLVGRYGWWGLAWLEAILRLADHRASAMEEQGEDVT